MLPITGERLSEAKHPGKIPVLLGIWEAEVGRFLQPSVLKPILAIQRLHSLENETVDRFKEFMQ